MAVIIPVHNMARELQLCLDALWKNDLTDTEILVVDDGSTDDAAAVARSVRYLRTGRRKGPAAARNEGFRQTDAPYVLFLDADVVLPADALAHIRETFEQHSANPAVVAVTGVYSEAISGGFLTQFKNLNVAYLQATTPSITPYVHSAIFCVRREALERCGGFDDRLRAAEDFRLGMIFGGKGYRCAIDRRVKGVHLKQYTLARLFQEDYRRIRDLQSIPLNPEQRAFFCRANRWSRLLSVIVPVPAAAAAGAAVAYSPAGMMAAALIAVFAALNSGFIRYCRSRRGFAFAAAAAGFLFIEMAWAQLCLVAVTLRRLPGSRGDERVFEDPGGA